MFGPWRYVPLPARKPGALRNGAPFEDWLLPAGLERVRRKLAGSADDDRRMVAILAMALSDGVPAVEAACAEALREGVHPADLRVALFNPFDLSNRAPPKPKPPNQQPPSNQLAFTLMPTP